MTIRRLALVALWALLAGFCMAADKPEEVKAEPGETRLDEAAADKFLAELKDHFAKHPCVKAKMVAEALDPLGLDNVTRTGYLVLRRTDNHLLRHFEKPSPSAMLISGERLLETKKEKEGQPPVVVAKNFKNAPRALAMMRSTMTGDLTELRRHFACAVFKRDGAEGKPADYRIVLTGKKFGLRRIAARIEEGAAFFREIEREQTAGDVVTERFTEVETPKSLKDKDFEDPLLRGKDPVQTDDVPETKDDGEGEGEAKKEAKTE
ncbi:MAG: hypothetical protein L6R28_07685 [Planctomycetes bacterium]|nr:hypothetical protein [Planctomycetota bacterium]